MLRTKIYIRNIDYNSIAGLIIPQLEKWLSRKDKFFYGTLAKIISKEGKPTGISNLFVSIIPRKNDIAASVLSHFDEVLIEYLNHWMNKNNILAKIESLKTVKQERKGQSMLRIEIDLDDIDYEATIEQQIPQLVQKLSGQEDTSGRLGHLLLSMNDLPGKAAKAAIGVIPKNQRDNLMEAVLTEYKAEIKSALNALITQNNIKAEIASLKVESVKIDNK